ncbi:MAG: segregation/condensation protein A [Terrisporobacter sp.]|jgi:segregation and condensation protein A|uniref:segregation and condensation protein A n=1 Tax=Terrisporobacter sp. TaxID=1965305 RepID=UPI002F92E8CB
MKYNIHLNVYDGPLDLLCDLISRQKIDIKDISISEITSQYLAYIDMLNEMDLEVASEFIIMASKLLEIKSRYLLYKQHHEEHEEDPRLELVGQLEEYKKFKEASLNMKDKVHYISDTFFRAKEEVIVDNKIDLDEISIDAIRKILPIILKTKVIEGFDKTEELDIIVKKKVVSSEEKMQDLKVLMSKEDKVSFVKLVEYYDKDETIATFLAILELIKEKLIVVVQNKFFDDILIIKRGVENE